MPDTANIPSPDTDKTASLLGIAHEDFDSILGKTAPEWGNLIETPCLHSPKLSQDHGCNLFLKYENLQYTASFKERGALAKLLSLSAEEQSRGVIAASAGNHAQGLARHAALLGVQATIIMPEHTPFVKVEQTRALGAKVVLEGHNYDDASALAHKACDRDGLTYVHPFDDPYVMTGQGTVAVEMISQAPKIDTLVVPIGGGGLISGVAAAIRVKNPDIKLVGVQAALYPGMINRLHGDEAPAGGTTLAEGIAVAHPGIHTARVVEALVDDIVTVEERHLERALSLLLVTQKTLAEGAGAAGLAAVIAHPEKYQDRNVGLIICGGNIDTRLLSSILMRDLARQQRLARLRIELVDVPGQLTLVSQAISAAGGNVIDISYHRIFNDLPAKATYIDISVEANDGAHMEHIIQTLKDEGLKVQLANY